MSSGTKPKLRPEEHLIAGTLAGLISTASLYPLDLIKSRYQVNELSGRAKPYKLYEAFATVLRNEGVLGLYQGLPSALYGSGMSWGGYFYFYEHAKVRWSNSTYSPTFQHLASACEAGVIMVGFTNPVWLVKTRMQLQKRQKTLMTAEHTSSIRPYRGFYDALTTIVREEGPLALYKGTVPALLLVSHGAIIFVLYEGLKVWGPAALGRELNSVDIFLMGAGTKVVSSFVTYPFQVIKTRIQQRDLELIKPGASASFLEHTKHRYTGVIDCIAKTFRYEGVYGFYKGVIVNSLRVAPSAAITFVAYEFIADLFRSRPRFSF